MKPIDALTAEEARGLSGLLFDLDDTLLSHGKLTEAAYSALFRLQDSGLSLLCVTGRPITWGKLLVRQWPIVAAVCETGALAAQRQGRTVTVLDSLTALEREHNRTRLHTLVRTMQDRFPQLVVAADATERTSDFTFDIGEAHSLAEEQITEASRFAEAQGARTSRSSVHLHVSYDTHDKASGTLAFLSQLRLADTTRARWAFAYVGDSENDASCFAAFHTSIGVQNLRGRPTVPPRFLTHAPQGAGFVEAALHIVAARRGGSAG